MRSTKRRRITRSQAGQAVSLNNLPAELSSMILSYIDRVGDAKALAETCRSINSAATVHLYKLDANKSYPRAIDWALLNERDETLRRVISLGIEAFQPVHFLAAFSIDKREFFEIMLKTPGLVAELTSTLQDRHGVHLLTSAIHDRNIDLVRLLLRYDVVEFGRSQGPVSVAVSLGQKKIVRMLLEKISDPWDIGAGSPSRWGRVEDTLGEPRHAFTYALNASDVGTIKQLLHYSDTSKPKVQLHLNHSLRLAIQKKNAKVVDLLLQKGCELDTLSRNGDKSFLSYACLAGSVEIFRLLRDHGATIQGRERRDRVTLLHEARSPGIAKELIADGLLINARCIKKLTPVMTACRAKAFDVVQFLLEAGAKWTYVGPHGPMLIHIAAYVGDVDCIRWIVNAGASVDQLSGGKKPYRPLHSAIKGGHQRSIRTLLELGADPYIASSHWQRPVDRAVHNLPLMKCMASCGVDFDTKDDNGRATIHLAIKSRREDLHNVVSHLAHVGADMNITDSEGGTPLHYAVEINKPDIVSKLLLHGANIDSKGADGTTPLMAACLNGFHLVATTLLLAKPDMLVVVEVPREDKYVNALDCALSYRCPSADVITHLLAAGVVPLIDIDEDLSRTSRKLFESCSAFVQNGTYNESDVESDSSEDKVRVKKEIQKLTPAEWQLV